MGVPAADPAVQIVADIWTVLFANSFSGLGCLATTRSTRASSVRSAAAPQYELFRRTWTPWASAYRPPTVNPPQALETDSDYLPLVTDSFVPVANRRRG